MGCNSSRSAGADGVIDNNRDQRNSNRTMNPDYMLGIENLRRSGRSASDRVPDPLYFSPNRAQFRFEFDDPQRRHTARPLTADSADSDHRRNTRLTILNVPSRSRARRRSTRGDGDADQSDAAVLEQLQIDLVTIERIFQSLLGQPYQAMSARNNTEIRVLTGENACPPACQEAIDGLSSIRIAAEDLEDENNRSCCICFGDHSLNDEVARLPCGHLFHRECVAEWLLKHCTCPFCRWELETDDERFNEGRMERMKSRRLRLKSYELERMTIDELRELASNVSDDNEEFENELSLEKATRDELMHKIKQSRMVDIIDPLPQVPTDINDDTSEEMYNIDELRSMDIEQLRQVLRESGINCNVECTQGIDNDDTDEKDRILQILLKNDNVGKSIDSNPTDIESKMHAAGEEEKEEICVGQAADID